MPNGHRSKQERKNLKPKYGVMAENLKWLQQGRVGSAILTP